MPEPKAVPRRQTLFGPVIWQTLNRISVLLYLAVLLIGFAAFAPGAFTGGSATTVIQLSATLAVVAIGMTFCLICGEVDLSVGGVAGLASTVAALEMSNGVAWPIAVVTAVFIGIVVGMLNGAFTALLASTFPRFPSFLVTLASLSLTMGLSQALQPMQQAIAINDVGFQKAFSYNSSILTSSTTWYAFAVAVCAHLVLAKSRFGYMIYSVGNNARAARLVGFRVLFAKFMVLSVSGFLASIGGLLMAGFMQAGFYAVAKGMEVDAIAAAVIGGTALFGGRGTVAGTIAGVLVLGVLNTGLLILQVPTNFQLVAKGMLVILALASSEYIRQRAIKT